MACMPSDRRGCRRMTRTPARLLDHAALPFLTPPRAPPARPTPRKPCPPPTLCLLQAGCRPSHLRCSRSTLPTPPMSPQPLTLPPRRSAGPLPPVTAGDRARQRSLLGLLRPRALHTACPMLCPVSMCPSRTDPPRTMATSPSPRSLRTQLATPSSPAPRTLGARLAWLPPMPPPLAAMLLAPPWRLKSPRPRALRPQRHRPRPLRALRHMTQTRKSPRLRL